MSDSHPLLRKRHKDTTTGALHRKVRYQQSCCSGVAQLWKQASSA